MSGRILIGTSSWADPGFIKDWYPPGMPAAQRLPWYAQRFEAVELNSSFYAIPERATVRRWCDATPDGFAYAIDVGYDMASYDLLTKINQMLNRDGSALVQAQTSQEAVS